MSSSGSLRAEKSRDQTNLTLVVILIQTIVKLVPEKDVMLAKDKIL